LRINIVLFALGVWLLQREPTLPSLLPALAMVALLPAVVYMRSDNRSARCLRCLLLGLVCAALGYYWAAGMAHVRLADALAHQWESRDLRVVGVVASLPQRDARSIRFYFDVERVLTPDAHVPGRIALTWWGRINEDQDTLVVPMVQAGERWELTVRLRQPRGTANPGGFDYEAWLLERGIRATGYVRSRGASRRLDAMVHAPAHWVEVAREKIRDRITRALPDATYAGVIVALAVGDQRAIPAAQWQIFTRTGVNHLMSISGLHVTMVSGLVLALTYAAWRRSARLTLRLPARKAAAAAGLIAAMAYTVLAGFAVPAQRTLYMLAVAALALWFGFTGPVSVVLAVALFVVLILDPWAVLAPGFWLSFGAVAVIMYVTVDRLRPSGWLKNWITVQWAVTLGLVPALLAWFQQVSLVSPFANAVAIPVVSLIVAPLTLLGAVLPFDLVLHLAHATMLACMWLLEWMSALPEAVWQQHAPPPWTVLAAVTGVVWLLLPRGFPARWLGAVALMPIFTSMPPPLTEGALKMTVLDVGQGLAVVLQTRNHALLYDTGPAYGPEADSGSRIVVPYLRAAGVTRLSGLIVSHDDIDHSGGAASVLSSVPVGWLLTSIPDLDPLLFQAPRSVRCHTEQTWEWDGVRFDVLGPTQESYGDVSLKDNDRSCVLKIATKSAHVLLPGDIERRGETALVETKRDQIHADVLVAPHQGSKTSSSEAFLGSVTPQAVIFPVGYRNRFGHPHKEVVARYGAIGSKIYRTDRDGAITVSLSEDGKLHIEPYRAVYRRYWQTSFDGDPVPDPEEL
jgi:competence protein ComEC